ncbi:MAG: hypothetical protein RLZZ479_953 [Bacteroidota bacterium]
MYRSHNCGELNASHINTEVTLAGWVQKSRDKGFMNWVDLRDRYGITQLIFDESRTEKTVFELAKTLGREFVIQVKGTVIEREAKNATIPTGDIEILVTEITLLNAALTPPFTIEDETVDITLLLEKITLQGITVYFNLGFFSIDFVKKIEDFGDGPRRC